MDQYVTIRVRLQPPLVRDLYTADRDKAALTEAMGVETMANAHQGVTRSLIKCAILPPAAG
jgi:hypothetical protein